MDWNFAEAVAAAEDESVLGIWTGARVQEEEYLKAGFGLISRSAKDLDMLSFGGDG